MGTATKAILGGGAAMVVSFVSMVVIGANAGRSVAGVDRETRNSVPYILGKLAEAANEMKGKEIAPGIFVNTATIENDQSLTYTYDVPAVRNGRYDGERKRDAQRKIQEAACDDRMMRKAMRGGASINYAYYDANGTLMFTIVVTEKACRYVT